MLPGGGEQIERVGGGEIGRVQITLQGGAVGAHHDDLLVTRGWRAAFHQGRFTKNAKVRRCGVANRRGACYSLPSASVKCWLFSGLGWGMSPLDAKEADPQVGLRHLPDHRSKPYFGVRA